MSRCLRSGFPCGMVLVLLTLHAGGDVRLDGRVLVDDKGPFLGLGATYMNALHDAKFNPARLRQELDDLKRHGFNFIRVLSMVGYHGFWDGYEIAPVAFVNRDGKTVSAWPDYDDQLAGLLDVAASYGLRTEITIFADAQLMPDVETRLAHMDRILRIVNERRDKVLMLEVANEAWQNGFPGDEGEEQLRAFGAYLKARTPLLVALSSPPDTSVDGLRTLYDASQADLATVHLSRDTRTEEGPWLPVRDSWRVGHALAIPASSNEPIGPGSSVASDDEPARLAGAAIFAYMAGLPIYVFHSNAGIRGARSFSEVRGADGFSALTRLLPADLPNWPRRDLARDDFPVKPALKRSTVGEVVGVEGCLYGPGAIRDHRFVAALMGVPPDGVHVTIIHSLQFTVYDALTGEVMGEYRGRSGDVVRVRGSQGVVIVQSVLDRPQ